MKYYLAVDGGGTKTEVVCCDEQSQIVGRGVSGPTNLTATSVMAASFNLQEAIRQATETLPAGWEVTKLAMGLAGMDTPSEAQKAQEIFTRALSELPIRKIELVNDIVIAMYSGTEKADAIALIAGTGSNCYGRNHLGAEAKVGGMDFLLTDDGSGYAIGRAILRSAVKSFDGRSEKSILEKLVCEKFRIPSIAELKTVVYYPMLTKAEVADLAPLCIEAHNQGDQIAQGILDHVIQDLQIMVSVVVEKLDMSNLSTDCVFVGGITNVEYIRQKLEKNLGEAYPLLKIVVPTEPPVHGAIILALKP